MCPSRANVPVRPKSYKTDNPSISCLKSQNSSKPSSIDQPSTPQYAFEEKDADVKQMPFGQISNIKPMVKESILAYGPLSKLDAQDKLEMKQFERSAMHEHLKPASQLSPIEATSQKLEAERWTGSDAERLYPGNMRPCKVKPWKPPKGWEKRADQDPRGSFEKFAIDRDVDIDQYDAYISMQAGERDIILYKGTVEMKLEYIDGDVHVCDAPAEIHGVLAAAFVFSILNKVNNTTKDHKSIPVAESSR